MSDEALRTTLNIGFRGRLRFGLGLVPRLEFKVKEDDRKRLLAQPRALRIKVPLGGECQNVPDGTSCDLSWKVRDEGGVDLPGRVLRGKVKVTGTTFRVLVDGNDPEVDLIKDRLFQKGALGCTIDLDLPYRLATTDLEPCYAFDNPLRLRVAPSPGEDGAITGKKMGAIIQFKPEVAEVFQRCDVSLAINEPRVRSQVSHEWEKDKYDVYRWAIGFEDLSRTHPTYLSPEDDDYTFRYSLRVREKETDSHTTAATGKIDGVKKPRLAAFSLELGGRIRAHGRIENLEKGTPLPLLVGCFSEGPPRWMPRRATTRVAADGAFEASFSAPPGLNRKKTFGLLSLPMPTDPGKPMQELGDALAHDEDTFVGFTGSDFAFLDNLVRYLCSKEAAEAADFYGAYDLQIGDKDGEKRFGGKAAQAGAGFVAELQRDLHELGFKIKFGQAGVFDLRTKWAVREFQLHAKLDHVALEDTKAAGKPYVKRLSSTRNLRPYRGPVSGVVNRRTRVLLKHWIRNRWRCPVVICTHTPGSGKSRSTLSDDSQGMNNIWLYDDVKKQKHRMYAYDFSKYYVDRVGEPILVGVYVVNKEQHGPKGLSWGKSEVLPETLVGSKELAKWERCAFRALRCQVQAEATGHFDVTNAWDVAFFSLGITHWTLRAGELGAFFAYLHHADPAAYEQALGFFGLWPEREWKGSRDMRAKSSETGGAGYSRALCTYHGFPMLEVDERQHGESDWDDREGKKQPRGGHKCQKVKVDFSHTKKRVESCYDYFRSWHWCYRFAMAARTCKGLQLAMWPYARKRIFNVLNTPWGDGLKMGDGKPATIGDVITSEMGVAMIMRWHGWGPAHIVNKKAGKYLGRALAKAKKEGKLDWSNPSTWTDAHQEALIAGIMAAARSCNSTIYVSLKRNVLDWKAEEGSARAGYGAATLSRKHRSYVRENERR